MAHWRAMPSPKQPVAGFGTGAEGKSASAPAVFPPDLHDGRHLKLKAILLLVWALVSFGVCFFGRDLQWMVAGWPLGPTHAHSQVEMLNLLGEEADAWAKLAGEPETRVHLYGKRDAKPGRKMGHVNRLRPL